MFSKVLQSVVPGDYDLHKYADMSEKGDLRKDKDRPPFSLTLMSGNFRKFNARYAPWLVVCVWGGGREGGWDADVWGG